MIVVVKYQTKYFEYDNKKKRLRAFLIMGGWEPV